MVDQRVGAILEQLRAEGVLDNTLVVFFADHGRPMPWGKQWLTVEGLQVPLLARGPGLQAGSVETGLVSLIDLAPSMLQRAGLPVPAWMEGRPIFGDSFPQRTQVFAARDRCGDAADRIRAVITTDHLFVRHFQPELPWMNWSGYKEASYLGLPLLRELHRAGALAAEQARFLEPGRPATELFDLQRDPLGLDNVAETEPARAAELAAELERWIRATGDRGALPDPSTEPSLAEIQAAKRLEYQRTWSKRGLDAEPSDVERVRWWLGQYGLAPESLPPR